MCRPCPEDSDYNSQFKVCVKTITKVEAPTCPEYATYNLGKKKCECPPEKPYSDEKKCFNCFEPQFYDKELNQCMICPEGEEYSKL